MTQSQFETAEHVPVALFKGIMSLVERKLREDVEAGSRKHLQGQAGSVRGEHMEKRTTEAAATPETHRLSIVASEKNERELNQLKAEVESVVEMIDYFLSNALHDELNAQPAPNFIRGDVMEGAIKMISGRLGMALNDY